MNENSEKIPLAVVVIAKDEAANIGRCLQAVSRCAELIVVDDHSIDKTVDIAREFGATVLTHPFESFAEQRNWAILHAGIKQDWVLMLDADEVATPQFLDEVSHAIKTASAETVGYTLCRKTMFMGKWLKYSDGFPVWIMRIVKKGNALFKDSGHGEIPVPKVDGELSVIKAPFLHYAFSKGINNWVHRHLKYAEREAHVELDTTTDFSFTQLLSFDKSIRRKALRNFGRRIPFRACMRFLYQYFFKWGFLDGRAGYIYCRMMADYEAMISLKKWEINHTRNNGSV